MTTNINTLVLDFSRVSGLARKVLVKNILSVLTLIGYEFLPSATPTFPLDITRLILQPLGHKRNTMSYDNSAIPTHLGSTAVYDVTTSYDEFLTAARDNVIVRKTLDGVEITVTPLGATVNFDAVVTAAQREAERLHATLFA